MTAEKIYPVIIKMDTKEVQIGSAKVEFKNKNLLEIGLYEWNAFLKDLKIISKKDDFLTLVKRYDYDYY